MASTNKTSNLELSQFIATDTPTWLVDYNGDMEKIDAGVNRVKELAETASTQAVGVTSGLQTTNQTVTTLSGQVANVQNQANTTTASVNGINNRLGNADISGIGDGTITGAIKAQNSNLENVEPIISNDLTSTNLEISVAQGSSYTIPEDGYYSLFVASTSQGTNSAWYLNGVYLFGNANLESIIVPLYLKKGTVLNTRENFGSYYIFGKHI